MATWVDLKELRLRICDPAGVIDIVSVTDATARAAVTTPAKQTAYQQADDDSYWLYDAELTAWDQIEDLELADIRLENLIDLYTLDAAAPRAVKLIMAGLGKRMGIARSGAGAETIQYQTLKDTYDFYKALAATMEEETAEDAAVDAGTTTGRYVRMRHPHIGGGM